MEKELRELMKIAAGEPPHQISTETVRRAVIRRRLREGVTAAAAAACLAGIGVFAANSSNALSSRVSNPVPGATASPPRYYLQQTYGSSQTVVRSTATGKVAGAVRCPLKSRLVSRQIAPATGQTFFADCQRGTGGTAVSRIYRFRLTPAGQVSGFSPVPGGNLPGLAVGRIAASATGAEVAVAVSPAGQQTDIDNIIVINTATGARATWDNVPARPGAMRFGITELALTSDGHELFFFGPSRCVKGGTGACHNNVWAIRKVSPATQGGSLGSSRLVLKQSDFTGWFSQAYINDFAINLTGSQLLLGAVGDGVTGWVGVIQASAATGKPVSFLYKQITGNGGAYRFLSANPSGRYLLFDAGPKNANNGWINQGKLVPLAPANGTNLGYETW
jgi:hypothetical protein